MNYSSTNNRKRRCNKLSLPCSCQWSIRFQPLNYLKKSQSDPVRITSINALHSNGCIPSKDQLVLAKTKAGIYGKEQLVAMKELLKLMDLNEGKKIPGHTIQNLLRIVTPNRKHITRHDVYNFRLKSMVTLRKMREKGESLESIKFEKDTLSHLIKAGGLDDFTTDYLDDSTTAVKDIYMEILSNEESRIKLFALLEKLGQIDEGFTYRIAYNQEQKCTGFVIMTAGMRSNFERFSSFLCLDAMKRTTNVHMWPYIGFAVMDDMKRTGVVCESFMLEERHEAYTFIMQSIFMMAPRVSKTDVKVIFGDEFITQDILDQTCLGHASLFHDHFHLERNIEKELGGSYNEVFDDIKGMMRASSKNNFDLHMTFALSHCK